MFAHTSRGQESRPTSHDMQMQLEHLYLFKEPWMREREEAEGGRSEELRKRERERESLTWPAVDPHRLSETQEENTNVTTLTRSRRETTDERREERLVRKGEKMREKWLFFVVIISEMNANLEELIEVVIVLFSCGGSGSLEPHLWWTAMSAVHCGYQLG